MKKIDSIKNILIELFCHDPQYYRHFICCDMYTLYRLNLKIYPLRRLIHILEKGSKPDRIYLNKTG